MIQNVKEKNLKRISRMFETQLQTSLDSMITIPQLVSYFWKTVLKLPTKLFFFSLQGICDYSSQYYEHQDKNLIFLKGSEKEKLGCCILLRGGSLKELVKVKRIFRQLILVKAHATFEKAFLMDESAQVDNFILPDHKSTHLLTFSLSPFVELPLPSDAILGQIEEELKNNDDLSKPVSQMLS